jgi:hypothetical protein
VPSAAPVELAWKQLDDLKFLLGSNWVHHEHGDIWADTVVNDHKTGKFLLKSGGVKVRFEKGRANSKTPWNLVFHAPKPGHMGGDTVSGGCGFYPDVHQDEHRTADGGVTKQETYRKAFCKGYGIKSEKSVSYHLVLERKGSKVRMKIGDLIDETLVRFENF